MRNDACIHEAGGILDSLTGVQIALLILLSISVVWLAFILYFHYFNNKEDDDKK